MRGDDRRPRPARREFELPLRRGAQPRQRALRGRDRRRARRRRSGRWRVGRAGISFSRLRGELIELPGGVRAGQRLLQRQPDLDAARRSTTSPRSRSAAAGSPSSAGWRELGPDAAGVPPRGRARTRAGSGSSPIVGVGELARDYAADEWAPDPRGGGRGRRRAARRGRRGPGQGLALGRARGVRRRGPGGHRRAGRGLMAPVADIGDVVTGAIDRGEVLIAGMAAMLITIFLGPKFIQFLRVREFGQQIREEGPQEHHAKAGTPTMGGLILFLAIAVPYLVLSEARHGQPRGLRRRRSAARRSASPTTSSRSPSAARSGSRRATSCSARSPSRWRSGGSPTSTLGLDPMLESRIFDAEIYIGPVALPALRLPRDRRRVERGQPHRRSRRAGRRVLRDRPARLHGDHDHQRPGRPGAARRLLRRRLDRLPLVQRVPGLDLHGRHGLARLRRRDRRASR